ncbi:hypothetical protein BS50DRAFT_594326 [Corynespora cassiicola Philippines]|uniref:Alpha/beta-hydrolase n=1 Tax=Corynespora cassiicola Philippines TaxID=1448308 RepID=A0A2T2N3B6_CORCC|nr:hypothetical protein BS50DRAFT_594326 [Corynespora cassiicola Philippines]
MTNLSDFILPEASRTHVLEEPSNKNILLKCRMSFKVALLVFWTLYGKHNPAPLFKIYPNCSADPFWLSEYTVFEAHNLLYWTRHGYAVIIIDVAGLWLGEGSPTFSSDTQEAEYHYECIDGL